MRVFGSSTIGALALAAMLSTAAVGYGTGYGAGKGALIGTGVGAAAGAIYDIYKYESRQNNPESRRN